MTKLTQKEKILKERARLLREIKEQPRDKGEQMEALEFVLANERYAIDTTFIAEVIRIKKLTPLPGTPAFILGIINVRGRILSVIDIKKLFNLPDEGISNLNRVIIVKNGAIEFGILTDEIIGNFPLTLNSLQKKISSLESSYKNFVLGITSERLIVLDLKEIINSDKIIVNDKN
ncbi:MAG: chemotaxis protein CheW [Prolixibacteraceae bacterium]|nr:chemotaxis protein CheW [Prolixibacteraceae bacterium]